ncbi:MAG TPA: hypothetical protein VFA10_22510 [Ktedonobacteraceae bacterium]|nr:hypothetical protein [Ktedonobacteraceae bacterium]
MRWSCTPKDEFQGEEAPDHAARDRALARTTARVSEPFPVHHFSRASLPALSASTPMRLPESASTRPLNTKDTPVPYHLWASPAFF